jgi:hypothetical protein
MSGEQPQDSYTEEQRYQALLDDLLVGVDLADETACRQAYAACMDYASDNLVGDLSVNLFLMRAAERLGQIRAHFSIVESMVLLPDEARLHLAYTEQGGPSLTGNPAGLRYLSEMLSILASATSPSEHVHFYENQPPLCGNSYRLTIYNESDDWFEKYAVPPDDANLTDEEQDEADALPRREVEPSGIIAFGLFGEEPPPPHLLLTARRLYRVSDFRPGAEGEGQGWIKDVDGGVRERYYVFSLCDDAGQPLELGLNLDDPEVEFFSRTELKQFLAE